MESNLLCTTSFPNRFEKGILVNSKTSILNLYLQCVLFSVFFNVTIGSTSQSVTRQRTLDLHIKQTVRVARVYFVALHKERDGKFSLCDSSQEIQRGLYKESEKKRARRSIMKGNKDISCI